MVSALCAELSCLLSSGVYSDASGVWGCQSACVAQLGQSSSSAWDQVAASWDISARELLPVVLASAVWGCLWSGAV